MSPTPFNVPLNAKVVANHGTTSVFALRDGRLAFVDHATKRVFFDGSRDVGSGTYGSGHNAAWADARLTAVAALGGSASFSMTKALKPRQSSSPFSEPEQPAADLPDEPFARMLPFIPKEFLDWAGSYEVGDPLPPMMPGYGGETLCNKSINDVSYSQDGISVERLVDAGLGALGLPEVNPELAFVPEPETKGLPGFEQKGILGREIRDMVRNIADSILSARGLWKDELNKIRCGSGPNANRFTDIFGTGCDVPGSGVAGNVVGAVRGAVDLPGPVDEIVGRAEGAREKLADAADGPDVPGSRPSLGERLRATTSRMRGGYTPVYVADTPGDLDPAAGMSSVMGSRRSERTGFWGLRTLVSRNKIRERLRKRQDEYSKMRADYQRFVNSDEHKRWAADFELRTGRAPHFGERVDQYARHLGWNGSFKDDKGNPMTDNAGRPVGSFMGGADTAVVDGVTRPDLTHFEAMIDEIMMQTAYEFNTERMKRKNREKAEEAVGEYMLATLHAMMNAGGPKKLPDGTDNPEHKERFAEVVPTFMRIKHPLDSSNNRPELKNAYVIASVNSFFGDDPETAFPGLPRLNRNQVNGGGSVPLWMAASNLSSAPPVYAQISLDPWFFSKKESQAGRLAGIQETHLGMVPEREAFIAHTADHELNHIDDFMKRLGDKLGYTAIPQEAQVPTSEYGEAAWRKRLSEQRFNIYSGWQNQIDLVRDLQYMEVVVGDDANGQPIKGLVPVSYFGRQVEELMMFLDPRNNRTGYERKRALWDFYMRNVRFNENVASEFARFLAAESPIAGVRITKADQQRILAKIIEDLEIRGFGEETGIPRLEFWGDMLDTPVGRWNPVSRQFEYPRDPISGELDVSPMNLMRPPSGNRAAFGQARLDNSVSNALHGFVGGTYAGESDFEFAAELRTHLNRQGALAEIREFLADSERNKQGLDESGFMTLVAKYVGTDEVHRLYGEKPPLRNAPTPSPSSAPPRRGGGSIGSTPRGIGAGGAAGRVRGSGTRPTVPMTPRADAPDSPTPPPASPGLRGTATRPTVPMAPRADAPADAPGDAPDVPPSSTGRVRGSGTRPTVPMAPRDATPGDAPESEAPSRVRGTGVRRPTRPTTDDDLVEPTVRTETDADRVSPERRRADADRERRVREVMGDDDGDLAEPTAKPETATRDDVEQYDDRRLIPEREEADRRAEEASRGMAKNRAAEATPSDRVERAVEDEKNNMVSSGRIRGRSDPMAMLKDPGDRARRARKLDEQVAARRKALDNASAATDPKERRGQQIVAAALEAELMYGVGEMDYGANERRQADLSILADLNGTPLYQDDEGIFKLESSVPEWQRTEGPESIDDSPESVASRTALAKEIFGEDQASEFLGTRSSETDGPIAGSQAARSRYKLQAGEPAPRTWSEERVNAEVRVMEAETSHDDALRKARATGSDPDRGGDGDPAAWADYRAAYDELNDADVERSRLSRESDEPEDRAPQSEAPTQAATADPSSEGANAERGAPRDQVRMVNKTTGETIYVDPSDARVMDEVTAEGFTRSNPKPSRKPTATRPDDPSNPPNTAAGNLMLMDTKKSDLAQAIIYDPKNGDLRVTYKDGRVVTFKNVWYERARKAGEDDRPDDLIEALEREQFQQISRPIGRLGDDGQGSRRQTGPRKKNRRGGRFHRMVDDSGDEILISVDDGDGYYDAQRDGYRDRGIVGGAEGGMASPARARSGSDGVREFLEEGDGAFMTPERARLQRDGAVERRRSAISERERLINERDGVENGVIGRNLTDEQAQRRVEELNRQIAEVEGRIEDLERTAELFSEQARKLEEGIPVRRMSSGGDAMAGMARGDRSRTLGRVAKGSMKERAMAKLLDKILDRTGADEETREKVKIGLGLATAFSAGGPAGAATYVALEAARRGGRDLAEFTIGELLKRGKIDGEQARKAMAAVDRIAPDGLPDDAKQRLGRAFSATAELFNERINTPENRRRLAEMGESVVDSARERARDLGERVRRPRRSGPSVEAGMSSSAGAMRYPAISENNVQKQTSRVVQSNDRVEKLLQAYDHYERTGDWLGADFGVTMMMKRDTSLGDLDVFDGGKPVNLTKAELAEIEAEEKISIRSQISSKIDKAKKEVVLQQFLSDQIAKQREQGILRLEDIPEDELEALVEEGRNLTDEDFVVGDGSFAAVHVGAPSLEGGVLDPDRTDGGGRENVGRSGNTGALNQYQLREARSRREYALDDLASRQRIVEAMRDPKRKITPKTRREAELLNQNFGLNDRSVQQSFEEGVEYDLNQDWIKANEDGYQRVIDSVEQYIPEAQETVDDYERLFARLEESPTMGFLSAYPASRGMNTQGYFGRNAHKAVPEDIATPLTEREADELRLGYTQFRDVKDQDMLRRWQSNLRGTGYLVIGDNATVTSQLGPFSGEVQLVGKNKPLFGFSTKLDLEDRQKIELAAKALMARAIKMHNEDREITPESVLDYRRTDGPGAGMAGGRQITGPRRAFNGGYPDRSGDGPSAGMGRNYDRFVGKHAGVVPTKRNEIDEVRRTLADVSGRPVGSPVTAAETQAIASAMERLFSGEIRLDRGTPDTRDVSISVRVSPRSVTTNRDGGLSIRIPIRLTSPDGNVDYGYAVNHVNVSRDGDVLGIEHGSIAIRKNYQGTGLASELNARNENIYRAIGAKSITLKGTSSSIPDSGNPSMPDMVLQTGATHWARNGFTWQDEESKQEFIGVIDRALRDKPGNFSAEERQRIGSLYRKGGDGKFETRATAEDLIDFESADRLFAEDGAVVRYRRDLTPLVLPENISTGMASNYDLNEEGNQLAETPSRPRGTGTRDAKRAQEITRQRILVQRIRSGQTTVAELSAQLGIPESTIYSWMEAMA